MDDKTVLKIKNISKSFNEHKVLKNLSIDIKDGEIFGIVGSSGSGKTTLIEIITGNLTPTKGNILISPNGQKLQSVYSNIQLLKQNMGYSPQKPSFYDNLTCAENLSFFGSLYGIPQDIQEANNKIILKMVGLGVWKNKLGKDLSGGMQKRLDLACAIIHDPKIIILDEPTSDLDILTRNQMWRLIKKINNNGTTVIMSSHFLEEIDELCDRMLILNKGKIEFQGSPRDMKLDKESKITIIIETAERKYEELARSIHQHYGDNAKFKANHELYISIDKENPLEEISKITEIIKESGQTIIKLNYTKESIADIFKKIQEET